MYPDATLEGYPDLEGSAVTHPEVWFGTGRTGRTSSPDESPIAYIADSLQRLFKHTSTFQGVSDGSLHKTYGSPARTPRQDGPGIFKACFDLCL